MNTILDFVDASLSRAGKCSLLTSLNFGSESAATMDNLGIHGLHPAFYRNAPPKVKQAFLGKLLPASTQEGEEPRSLTAQLILETVKQGKGIDVQGLRAAWHTGFLNGDQRLLLNSDRVERQRKRWAVFTGRQYQRFILELFLRCFEHALEEGCTSIHAIVEFSLTKFNESGRTKAGTLRDLIEAEAKRVGGSKDLKSAAARWNEKVHAQHEAFDWIEETSLDEDLGRALQMLCRWFLRAHSWKGMVKEYPQLKWDGAERISMDWFMDWIEARLDWKLERLLNELFADLIFAQHLRIALIRFDGRVQRLRFILGDDGITPTESARGDLARAPSWMADRLDAFVQLLSDLDVLVVREDQGGALSIHPDAEKNPVIRELKG